MPSVVHVLQRARARAGCEHEGPYPQVNHIPTVREPPHSPRLSGVPGDSPPPILSQPSLSSESPPPTICVNLEDVALPLATRQVAHRARGIHAVDIAYELGKQHYNAKEYRSALREFDRCAREGT